MNIELLFKWLHKAILPHHYDCEILAKAGRGGKCTCGRDEIVAYMEKWNKE